jgi:hypothetical protein
MFGYATGKAIAARMLERENRSQVPPTMPVTITVSVPF